MDNEWEPVFDHTAPDGFKATIKKRKGILGDDVFAAFRDDGYQLFGMQEFPSADQVRRAIGQ